MEDKIDIFSLGNYGLKSAQNKSSDMKCAEIFFGKNKYVNIEVEENSVKNSEIGTDRGVSIRIIDKRGSLGFAFTNKLDKKSIDKIVNLALKMMRYPMNLIVLKNLVLLVDLSMLLVNLEDTKRY